MSFLETLEQVGCGSFDGLPKSLVYYLAAPYTNTTRYYQEINYLNILSVSAELIKKGYIFIDPISSCHQQSQRFGLPGDYEYWKQRDRALIERSAAILVLWSKDVYGSIGVNDEVQYAMSLGKKVFAIFQIHGSVYAACELVGRVTETVDGDEDG